LLLELPHPQREAIWLHLFAGCTFAEVARVAGVPTFTAASRFRLGVARLRRLMGIPR
jgi:DNA-directed RNA polymerase specialized sigma24 family protein